MLQSVKQLFGDKLRASDGEIGRLKDFYFDDQNWAVRYVVADTGSWLPGRQVLISPQAFGGLHQAGNVLDVNLTRKQIEDTPSIQSHKPVSRQYEEEYHRYYCWPYYWQGDAFGGMAGSPILEPAATPLPIVQALVSANYGEGADAHLRSLKDMVGFKVQASDGTIGHVCDFLMDSQSLAIRELIIKGDGSFSGRELHISTSTIDRISDDQTTVLVSLTTEGIDQIPEDRFASQSILKTNPLKQGALTEHSEGIGTVTRKMMRERAVELAVSNGHSAEGVSKSDWEQARQELMGERNSPPNITSGPGDSSENIEAKLKDHPFLKGLKPEYLAILGRHARMAEFSAGKMIFHQNEHAHQFYFILDGRVSVESYVARADSIPLQIVGAGDVLGWSWLFPPFTWHFQARSLEATKAIFLDGASILAACEEDSSFGYEVMQRIAKVVVSRLETTQKRFFEIQKTRAFYPDITELRHNGAVGHVAEKSLEEMLATHPFFEGMRSEHLGILADSAMKSHFDAGQVVFREGDPANRFYLIQHGKVVLEAAGTDKTPVPFQIIGDGDVLGWSWLLPPFYSHFEARALEPTQSIFLYAPRLRDVCEQNHELGYALLKRTVAVVIQRLQATRERLLELSEKSPFVANDALCR